MAIRIIPYDDTLHKKAFKQLNEQWIREMFSLEDEDNRVLNDPLSTIILPGGAIFIAEEDGKIIGTVGLQKPSDARFDWELIKFAVDKEIQGAGVGRKLIEQAIAFIQEKGARTLWIESNRKCAAAIHLYLNFGFREIPIENPGFARCDIQLLLEFPQKGC